MKRRLECLPWQLLLVSISRSCCEVGTLAHKARRAESAKDGGDSNMIQARSEW